MSAYRIPRYTCRLVRDGSLERPTVGSFEAASALLWKLTSELPFEQVWVFYIDGRNRLNGAEMIAQGGLHGAAVCPREVFRGAILASASAVILGHNHPSGDPTPSGADVHLTKAIAEAGNVLGIALLDHVIVGTEFEARTSMRETHGGLFK